MFVIIVEIFVFVGIGGVFVGCYNGFFDVVKYVLKFEGGVFGLYKGFIFILMCEVLGNVVMFGVYEVIK